MNNTNTGGSAFPVIFEWGNGDWVNEPGMTLRDYFAANAMQGDVSAGAHDGEFPAIAKRAYAMADAMLKAREK
jgi:hypothetical protein